MMLEEEEGKRTREVFEGEGRRRKCLMGKRKEEGPGKGGKRRNGK